MKPRNRRERQLVQKAKRLLEMAHLNVQGGGGSPINRGLQGSWMGKADAAEMCNDICKPGGTGRPRIGSTEYVSIAWTGQGSGPDCVLCPKSQVDSGNLDPTEWIAIELKTGTGNWSGTAANHAKLINGITKFAKSGATPSASWNAIYAAPNLPNLVNALTNPTDTWDQGFINNLQPASWSGAPTLQQIQSVLSTSTTLPGDYAICFSVGSEFTGVTMGGLTMNNFGDLSQAGASMTGSKTFQLTGPGAAVSSFNIQAGLRAVSKLKFPQADADYCADIILARQATAWPNWDVACQSAGLSSTSWDKPTIADFILHGATTSYSGDPETIYGADHWACFGKTAAQVKQWHADSLPNFSRTGSGMGYVLAILSLCFGVPYIPKSRRTDAATQDAIYEQAEKLASWMGKGNTL